MVFCAYMYFFAANRIIYVLAIGCNVYSTRRMLARSSHSLLKSSHVHIARIVLAQFSCMYMYMLMPQRVSCSQTVAAPPRMLNEINAALEY